MNAAEAARTPEPAVAALAGVTSTGAVLIDAVLIGPVLIGAVTGAPAAAGRTCSAPAVPQPASVTAPTVTSVATAGHRRAPIRINPFSRLSFGSKDINARNECPRY
ncbi:hypothetical protein Misp02_13220 [Microtetraspora sp. NBRC 16547]|nr:hypothetical protein Misp02_13220 [Microtetraspora sp. NBRC 16547]